MAVANPKYEFNIMDFGVDIPRSKIAEAREAVREFLLDTVLVYVSEGKSPVKGERKSFPLLDKEYAKEFKGGTRKATLEEEGDMLDALDIRVKGNKLTLLVDDSSQKGKSDGHNDHSGRSKLPKRRFIPKEEQGFRKSIQNDIIEILMEYERTDGE